MKKIDFKNILAGVGIFSLFIVLVILLLGGFRSDDAITASLLNIENQNTEEDFYSVKGSITILLVDSKPYYADPYDFSMLRRGIPVDPAIPFTLLPLGAKDYDENKEPWNKKTFNDLSIATYIIKQKTHPVNYDFPYIYCVDSKNKIIYDGKNKENQVSLVINEPKNISCTFSNCPRADHGCPVRIQ